MAASRKSLNAGILIDSDNRNPIPGKGEGWGVGIPLRANDHASTCAGGQADCERGLADRDLALTDDDGDALGFGVGARLHVDRPLGRGARGCGSNRGETRSSEGYARRRGNNPSGSVHRAKTVLPQRGV